jgi:hypothetical protein
MAYGDTLLWWDALDNRPAYRAQPFTNSVPITDQRGEARSLLLFPPGQTQMFAYFEAVMPRAYAGGGLMLVLCVAASSGVTGGMYWYGSFESHYKDRSLWTDYWGPVRGGYTVAPSVAGAPAYVQIGFEPGATDGIQVGEHFRLRIQMPSSDIPGYLDLYGIELVEL